MKPFQVGSGVRCRGGEVTDPHGLGTHVRSTASGRVNQTGRQRDWS